MDTSALLAAAGLSGAAAPEILATAYQWARAGRESDAQELYDHAGALRPKKQMRAYWPLALTAGKPGDEWATPALKRADLHINHQQHDEARAILDGITAPDLRAQVLTAHARVALAAGAAAEGLRLAEQAHQRAPASSSAAIVRAVALLTLRRDAEAVPLLLTAGNAGREGAWFLLGLAYQNLDRAGDAADAYRKGYRFDPDDFGPANNLFSALGETREYKAMITHADEMLAARPGHTTSLAYKHIALGEEGRLDDLAALTDIGLLERETLAVPAEYNDRAAFHRALAAEIAADPTLAYQRNTTRFGYQTDDVSLAASPALKTLHAILAAVARRRADAARTQPTHSFHRAAPRNFQLYSWGVILNEKGFQAPHFHPHGWLSGVYYIEVPPDITSADPARAGWIEFGRGDERWNQAATPMPVTQLQPEEGLLLTFPSFFWHNTRPTMSNRTRISFAFDVIPVEGP